MAPQSLQKRAEIGDDSFPKNGTLTVGNFGIPERAETFSHDEEVLARGTGGWQGTVQTQAMGLTLLFGLAGAVAVTAGVGIGTRLAGSTTERTDVRGGTSRFAGSVAVSGSASDRGRK